ncbi:MAG: exodeoxyribonuclease small subunit [Candidatus Midichloriaceae bacterium]|jgi:exodeoxyribonuclease VII small subunit|nr:exodeoxyribonuclease small subunit [Candidatus Midichloriaceae bacterium]
MSKSEIKNLSFEQSLSELENIVRKLESGSAELESSIDLYSRGIALKEHCEKILANAKLKVEKIISKDGEAVATEAFNPSSETNI